MAKLNIKVTSHSNTGRNTHFNVNGNSYTRAQTANIIKRTPNSGYHVRKINGLNTPVSNPDRTRKNNLG
ncbi:MAG: hypothetical protein HRT98_00180 [Mycoplasmatales bacterium]|nr:hypothetical protein [Mycoplasmatales bacterium]